jgi:hypothetical protein
LTRLVIAIALVTIGIGAAAEAPAIHTEDVTRFYQVYEAAGGHPTADAIQRDYIDPGSVGLQSLEKTRNVTGATIARNLAAHAEMYATARQCLTVLPQVRARLEIALAKMRDLYPAMSDRPIFIAVSRGKPVGIADSSGVIIGLEALCAVQWMASNVEDRYVQVIVHEYTHVQQAIAEPTFYDNPKPTVLEGALVEGAAEFTAKLITGGAATYDALEVTTKGHEAQIETAFAADEDSTDLSKWFNNSTMTKPGDLGYWVGYRIVKSFYDRSGDKRAAFREILQIHDSKAFLDASGWHAPAPQQS